MHGVSTQKFTKEKVMEIITSNRRAFALAALTSGSLMLPQIANAQPSSKSRQEGIGQFGSDSQERG